jgi:hypothetical protein
MFSLCERNLTKATFLCSIRYARVIVVSLIGGVFRRQSKPKNGNPNTSIAHADNPIPNVASSRAATMTKLVPEHHGKCDTNASIAFQAIPNTNISDYEKDLNKIALVLSRRFLVSALLTQHTPPSSSHTLAFCTMV